MAQDIIGMLGLSPDEIARQRQANAQASAFKYAQLDPYQQANYLGALGGQSLGEALGGMMGIENRQQANARKLQDVMTQEGDLTSSKGLNAKAEQLRQAGLTREALVLATKAKELEKQEAAAALAERKQTAIEKKDDALRLLQMAQAEKALREPSMSQAAAIQEYKQALDTGFKGSFMDFLRQKAMQTPAGMKIELGGPPIGKPPIGYRFTPTGDLESIPGGPADIKAKDAAEKKLLGEGEVGTTIATLRDAYDRLEKGGGITSTKKTGVENLVPSLSSTGIGQAFGKAFGTENQSARNDIAMARPGLLAALMKATGMSAKQIDSNAELKLWLATATDPTLDVESNRKALKNIEDKYLSGKSTEEWERGPDGKLRRKQ